MSSAQKPVRWGLLGAARIAESALIPALRRTGSPIVAVGCRDLERGRAYAARNGIATATDYQALLAHPDIDAIYIGLHNGAHMPWTLAALAAGKHVLCEKPLALNPDQISQMIAAQRVHDRVAMEAFMYRFHPMIDRLRDLVKEGAIGTPRLMRGAFTVQLNNPGDVRWDPTMGGGAMYDLGCYPMSLMRHVSGMEPDAVATQTIKTDRGVDDASSVLLRFGAMRALLDSSFSLPFNQFFDILGDEGVARLDRPYSSNNMPAVLRINDREEHFAAVDPYALMVEHFEGVIRGEEAQRLPLEDSLAQSQALERVFELMRKEV